VHKLTICERERVYPIVSRLAFPYCSERLNGGVVSNLVAYQLPSLTPSKRASEGVTDKMEECKKPIDEEGASGEGARRVSEKVCTADAG